MDTVIHTYLTRLRIISKIPTNGKIDTTNNDLNIYYSSISSWVRRKMQGDSKDNATKYLTDLYKEINAFSDQLMSNVDTENDKINKHKKIIMLTSLAEKIKESLAGIRNLIGTYKDYLKTVSLLECLEQDIIMPQYRVMQDFIPKSYHTEIMIGTLDANSMGGLGISPTRANTPGRSPVQTRMHTYPTHSAESRGHSLPGSNGNLATSYHAKREKLSLHATSDPININQLG